MYKRIRMLCLSEYSGDIEIIQVDWGDLGHLVGGQSQSEKVRGLTNEGGLQERRKVWLVPGVCAGCQAWRPRSSQGRSQGKLWRGRWSRTWRTSYPNCPWRKVLGAEALQGKGPELTDPHSGLDNKQNIMQRFTNNLRCVYVSDFPYNSRVVTVLLLIH